MLLVLREPLVTAGPVDGLGGASPLAAWSGRRAAARDARRAGQAIRRAAHTRLARRLAEATDLLAPAGIVVTPLDAGTATSVLAAACNPAGLVPPAALAAPDEVITADLPEGYPAYQPDPDGGGFPDDGFDDPDGAGPGYGDRFDDADGDGPPDTDDPDFWDPPDLRPPAGRSDGGSRRPARPTRRRGQAR